MSYLSDYNAQRRHLSRLARALDLPLSRHNGKRRVPLGNDELRVSIHDACLGPNWDDVTDGQNAAQMDLYLGRTVDTAHMQNGYELAVAQACIRAGKHEARMARADMAILRDSKGRTVFRPMTHAHRMARFKAASEFYAAAREYQEKHEEARRAANRG
ncbi:hypothetical protein [Caballeronia zhejiangensis]|jgi:hypothetical protein|uniref:hypothetical protein n=1 Tax=Caballeronia zhejiangensis TaxID=871203 RepID=UPI001FCF92B0|nr:hypothetical protein [Caballeronia zhejiangensis]